MELSKGQLERFWKRVHKTDSCWLWDNPESDGYGSFCYNRHRVKAHRLSLELHLGRPIMNGMIVAHNPIMCHNRSCVNPLHLREATQIENEHDKVLDGTHAMGQRNGRCKLTVENVLAIRADTRTCKIIALEYKVSEGAINDIKLRRNWAWLT